MAKQEIRNVSALTGFLYSHVFINLMYVAFSIFSLFDSKARRGFKGRTELFRLLKENMSRVPEDKRVWFHASSLGEFEQAKPIIEILKKSGYHVIASFFSPSGYDYSRNYPYADIVTYLPIDTPANARRFISLVKPSVAVIMRYDLWMNHLKEARKWGTKIILADATFPMKVFQRAKFLRNFYRQLYSMPHEILTTTIEHKKMFDFFLGSEVATVVGDTRFDRVYNRSISNNMARGLPFSIDKARKTVLILGSVWHKDLEVIAGGLKRMLRKLESLSVLIVPHEPTTEEVGRIREEIPEAKVLSELGEEEGNDFSALIVDKVGILTQLYVLADIAYVGGGFGAGVHSVLEPAVYGVPIVTGPRIERSDEAVRLLETGGLFYVKDQAGAYRVLHRMVVNDAARKQAGRIAKTFVDEHLGASEAVAARVRQLCGG